MKLKEAIQILKTDIESIDLTTLKGFDFYYDTFWSGNYQKEIELEDDEVLSFYGSISFNINDGEIVDIEILDYEYFTLWDNEGNELQNF